MYIFENLDDLSPSFVFSNDVSFFQKFGNLEKNLKRLAKTPFLDEIMKRGYGAAAAAVCCALSLSCSCVGDVDGKRVLKSQHIQTTYFDVTTTIFSHRSRERERRDDKTKA